MTDIYWCKVCGDEWTFLPEDFDNEENYPKVCPLCSMPITQMWHDTYKEGGFKESLIQTLKRIL